MSVAEGSKKELRLTAGFSLTIDVKTGERRPGYDFGPNKGERYKDVKFSPQAIDSFALGADLVTVSQSGLRREYKKDADNVDVTDSGAKRILRYHANEDSGAFPR